MADTGSGMEDENFGTLKMTSDVSRDRNKKMRILTKLTRPSSTLILGSKAKLRHQNRDRLCCLLNKLMKRRNWPDAAGVLAVLLQASLNERSLHINRLKYSGAMEILAHVESGRAYSKEIDEVYNLWLKKLVTKKNRPLKDRFVLIDNLVSLLVEKNYDAARSTAICLKQDQEADKDPISNLVLGLCHYELWYRTLPEERQLIDMLQQETHEEMEYDIVYNSEGGQADSVQDTNTNYLSETSVMNDKVIQNNNLKRKDSVAYDDLERGRKKNQSHFQGMTTKSADMSGSEGSLKNTTPRPCSSVFSSHGVPDSLLFPIQWDRLNENIADVLKELKPNDDYKDAVEFLRKAINSTPAVVEALLPLVQLLLLNDSVTEAFDEIDRFSYTSEAPFASRLKVHCLECLGCNNLEQLCSSYEDILKKDPTCRHALTKLMLVCQTGDYRLERLLEMIALYLDAAFGDHDIWRGFASCLLKVTRVEEDRVSTCLNGDAGGSSNQNNEVPTMFIKGVQGGVWRMRCKWWLNRHFNKKLLQSEMEGGELSLMAYKAASAAQLYGPGSYYVGKVSAFLKEEDESFSKVLNEYVESTSSGIFPGSIAGSKRRLV